MLDSILIHTCCADCLLNTLHYLENEKYISENTNVTSLFFNPNIHPRSEYMERLDSVKKILPKNAKLIIPDYKPKEYFKSIEGRENRCLGCWDLRIGYLFDYAMESKNKNITSTLFVSQYQNVELIKGIVKKYNDKYKLNFVDVSSVHNEKHTGFYKQNYCGCCFSLVEKMNSNNS